MDNPFKIWREQKRYKAKELAEKLGVPASSVSRIENGTQLPSFETMRKYCELGLNINAIMLGQDSLDIGTTSRAQNTEALEPYKLLAEERAGHIETLKKQLAMLEKAVERITK